MRIEDRIQHGIFLGIRQQQRYEHIAPDIPASEEEKELYKKPDPLTMTQREVLEVPLPEVRPNENGEFVTSSRKYITQEQFE